MKITNKILIAVAVLGLSLSAQANRVNPNGGTATAGAKRIDTTTNLKGAKKAAKAQRGMMNASGVVGNVGITAEAAISEVNGSVVSTSLLTDVIEALAQIKKLHRNRYLDKMAEIFEEYIDEPFVQKGELNVAQITSLVGVAGKLDSMFSKTAQTVSQKVQEFLLAINTNLEEFIDCKVNGQAA